MDGKGPDMEISRETALEAAEKTNANVPGERGSFSTFKYFKSSKVHAKKVPGSPRTLVTCP